MKSPLVISSLSVRDPEYLNSLLICSIEEEPGASKKLIDLAKACEFNAVKFQKRNPDVCVPEHQKSVLRDTPWGKMSYIDYKHRVEFEHQEYDYIQKYCKEKPIDWTASVWDLDSLKFICNYSVPFVKISSASITNLEFFI